MKFFNRKTIGSISCMPLVGLSSTTLHPYSANISIMAISLSSFLVIIRSVRQVEALPPVARGVVGGGGVVIYPLLNYVNFYFHRKNKLL
jgi:hypothetical protein